ncbi:peptidoglycan DD-metalloendopeptidase family protein [Vibrio casei]|uniref:LysM peptidoglycan-binding domain-containing protein n=1 Tax=Vibrio casei TaxID=673372 RepID=A0A368LLI8_9VIBR|nr:LysM peptidoglycan-binding domain-containing protein [Vibrio casei]SJN23645.1 Lipoprotein NlpD [Vibrio casei]HBV75686.1 LysM peptidoglycan-binding domain-containing protein [Vibrio sp.]
MVLIKRFLTSLVFFFFLAGCSYQPSKDDRGSYKGSYYVVEKGDSVYVISVLADKDVNDIIRYNHLKAPYTIHPGQKLNLWRPVYTPPSFDGTGAGNSQTASISKKNTSNSTTKVSRKESTSPVVQSKAKEYVEVESKQNVNNSVTQTTSKNDKVERWVWPTKGRVISKFSIGEQGNKGIDIAGQRGQDVVSTASGVVVYAGNALRGYGNLIIIKHNDEYLSAYAHNDRLLIREGQSVKTGQKIASMGSTGTNSVRLHFEIRYKGKSVNPERYLE